MREKAMYKAYWFTHDCNAKDDPKIMILIDELGLEGYGIYWVLIETLREQKEYKYPLKLLGYLARKYNTSAQKMEVIVLNYTLFEIENNEFFISKSLCKRMEKYDEKVKKLTINAKKGVLTRKLKMQEQLEKLSALDSTKQLPSKSLAIAKLKEKKIEKNRTKKKTLSSSFSDLMSFKKHVIENKNNFEFSLYYPNQFNFLKKTKFKIRDGYLHNTVSSKDLEAKLAIEIWHYLFNNQELIIGIADE